MTYLDWFNHRRLHGRLTDNNGHVTPADACQPFRGGLSSQRWNWWFGC